MGYSYDCRDRIASDQEWKGKWLEQWRQKRFKQLCEKSSEAVEDAELVCRELDQSTDSDALSKPSKLANEVLGDLQNLADTETLEGFVRLMKVVVNEEIPALEAALKKAKKDAKDNGDDEPDTTALDAIENATDYLRDVKKTCKVVEREMVKAPPTPPPPPKSDDEDESEDDELPELEDEE